ncbi:MAG TPA: hypothetical protein VKQ36_17210 [Ktedonobacterales bacterium]|nr:hypothetical protein [Ktedonobacterales bacterium]
MPLTLSQIAANRATVTVDFAGETIHLEYAPSLVTEKTIAEAIALQDAVERSMGDAKQVDPDTMTEEEGRQNIRSFADTMAEVNTFLCRAILAWDVYEDAEMTRQFPLTPERICELPIEFRAKCFRALQSGWRLGEANGTRSSRRSRTSSTTATPSGSNR